MPPPLGSASTTAPDDLGHSHEGAERAPRTTLSPASRSCQRLLGAGLRRGSRVSTQSTRLLAVTPQVSPTLCQCRCPALPGSCDEGPSWHCHTAAGLRFRKLSTVTESPKMMEGENFRAGMSCGPLRTPHVGSTTLLHGAGSPSPPEPATPAKCMD